MACRRTRRYFTVDEALDKVLDDFENELFGLNARGSESEDDDDSVDGDDRPVTISSDVDDDGEHDDHFLDRGIDVQQAVKAFVHQPASQPGGSEDMGDATSSTAANTDQCSGNVSSASALKGQSVPEAKRCFSKDCLKHFDAAEILQSRMNSQELERDEKDMLLLGILESLKYSSEENYYGKKRKRAAFCYKFQGLQICVNAFRYIYSIGTRQFKNILKHLETVGPTPRVHGNSGRRPHHALTFPVVEHLVVFLKRYAEMYGIPHPAPLRGRDGVPPVFLPAQKTYKDIHKDYVEACTQTDTRAVAMTSFRTIWNQCLPHIKLMSVRSDVCDKCEVLRRIVSTAGSEEASLTACTALADHIHDAQREREYYHEKTLDAKAELSDFALLEPPPVQPCSRNLCKPHYTFDFAQNILLPHTARQVGPIYFKTPRKVMLFGVNSEGLPKQVNYLIDEAETIGVNGTKSHGANTVVSLLHHFFAYHGHGEKECWLHADNCAGQNKNKTVMAYLMWRVLRGLHQKITISFMVAGHTRCLVDGCFGLLKQKFRRHDVFTLEQLAHVVDSSASCNVTQLLTNSGVVWRSWDTFLPEHFVRIPGVSKAHHFVFDATKPGVVVVKDRVEAPGA